MCPKAIQGIAGISGKCEYTLFNLHNAVLYNNNDNDIYYTNRYIHGKVRIYYFIEFITQPWRTYQSVYDQLCT